MTNSEQTDCACRVGDSLAKCRAYQAASADGCRDEHSPASNPECVHAPTDRQALTPLERERLMYALAAPDPDRAPITEIQIGFVVNACEAILAERLAPIVAMVDEWVVWAEVSGIHGPMTVFATMLRAALTAGSL